MSGEYFYYKFSYFVYNIFKSTYMKIKFTLIVFVVSVFCFGTTYGQNEFVALTSSQLLKGLNNKDYLTTILTEDGFTLINKSKPPKSESSKSKSGTFEYWQYGSTIFIDIISNPGKENYIIVRVYKEFTDLSERLIQTFPQRKDKEFNDQIDHIKVSNLTKETACTLSYSSQNENVGVDVWYDDPFYYFQYMNWKESTK